MHSTMSSSPWRRGITMGRGRDPDGWRGRDAGRGSWMVAVAFALWSSAAAAQDSTAAPRGGPPPTTVSVYGFVRAEAWVDSRQIASLGNGTVSLFPLPERLDANGEDLNGSASSNSIALGTRLGANVAGPVALGARSSGRFEVDFVGTTEATVGSIRLRHAYVTFEWPRFTLLVGQTWHPMANNDIFQHIHFYPFPFLPTSFNPQLRGTLTLQGTRLSGVLATGNQLLGPSGLSTQYLRNALLPDAGLKIERDFGPNVIGLQGGYKRVRPRTEVQNGTGVVLKATEEVGGYYFGGYTNIVTKPAAFNLNVAYGQNLTDLLLLGGYAVKSLNPATGEESYTPTKTLSVSGEIARARFLARSINYGVWGGFEKQYGTEDPNAGIYFAQGYTPNLAIDKLYRVIPHLTVRSGATLFFANVQFTWAEWGTPDAEGRVRNAESVLHVRPTVGFLLLFGKFTKL